MSNVPESLLNQIKKEVNQEVEPVVDFEVEKERLRSVLEKKEVEEYNTIINAFTEEQKDTIVELKKRQEDELDLDELELDESEFYNRYDVILKRIRNRETKYSKGEMRYILGTSKLATMYLIYIETDLHEAVSLSTLSYFVTNGEVKNFKGVEGLKKRLYATYKSLRERNKSSKTYSKELSKDELSSEIEEYEYDSLDRLIIKIRRDFKYNNSTFEYAISLYRKLVDLITEDDDPNKDLHSYLIYYAIGSIKRTIYNNPNKPKDPKMIYFYGAQGAGKSMLSEKLFGMLPNHFAYRTATLKIDHESSWEEIVRSAVTFFDEFSKITKEETMNNFKTMITWGKLGNRKLGTESHALYESKTTFFGCSNKPLNSMIKDPTGLRRFWQINFRRNIDHDKINKMEQDGFFNELYRVVDEENFEENYHLYKGRIETYQREYLMDDGIFTEFAKYYGLKNSNVAEADMIVPAVCMREVFKDWCVLLGKLDDAVEQQIIPHVNVSEAKARAKFAAGFKKVIESNTTNTKTIYRTVHYVKCNERFKDALLSTDSYKPENEIK